METQRIDPPAAASELDMLLAWLEYHRATFAWKCEGLSPDDLRRRSVPPSTMSLLGLVRHMAEVERRWFQRGIAAEDAPPLYYSDADPDGDFDNVDTADVDEAFRTWNAAVPRRRRDHRRPLARRHRFARGPRRAHAAMDPDPHDRGVRAAQRPRGSHP